METLFDKKVIPMFEGGRGKEWLEEARVVAEKLGSSGSLVDVNMVRDVVPPPEDIDPRIMGAIFRTKQWKKIGYVNSGRATCHNRPIAQFVLKSFSSIGE